MINKAILIGRVGKEPEINRLPSGATVAKFSLATSRKYTDKGGEKKEEVYWHNCVLWNKLAEVVEKYVKKGDMLYLEGEITYRSWEKDGTKHYMTEIVCHTMQMLGWKSEAKSNDDKGEIDYERKDKHFEPEIMGDDEESSLDLPF